MAEVRSSNPLVEQFKRGVVPRELKLMAAQGALPLAPADLTDLLLHLTHDAEAAVSTAATGTLGSLHLDQMLPLASDKATPPHVLGWMVVNRPERDLREPALQNPSTPDEAVEAVATSLPEALAELVVINQVRLLRRTSLLVALESNPGLSNDQRRRLRELRETFRIGQAEEAPPPAEPAPVPSPEPAAQAAPEEPAEPAAEAAPEEEPATDEEAFAHYLTAEERREPEKLSAVQRIYKMTTAQKVIAALKGSREERGILIRDRNRLVSLAVLGSPRVTDTEIETFAAMKNISQDVVRAIATHKEHTKKYNVVLALVKNARTPVGLSLGMLARLNPRDLKGLTTDRNVSEVIRKAAQRISRQALERK